MEFLASQDFAKVVSVLAATVGVVAALASLLGAMRAGVLRKIRLGSIDIEIEANSQEAIEFRKAYKESLQEVTKEQVTSDANQGGMDSGIPFEVTQLSNYYAQILSQSKVSFWFSLVFASIGFSVIISSAFLYSEGGLQATIVQFFSGVVVDAVAALFFVQSKNAQKSMGDFFDKLRRDRLHAESRKICEQIESSEAKDALRVHLSLHYAEVQNSQEISKAIADTCFRK